MSGKNRNQKLSKKKNRHIERGSWMEYGIVSPYVLLQGENFFTHYIPSDIDLSGVFKTVDGFPITIGMTLHHNNNLVSDNYFRPEIVRAFGMNNYGYLVVTEVDSHPHFYHTPCLTGVLDCYWANKANWLPLKKRDIKTVQSNAKCDTGIKVHGRDGVYQSVCVVCNSSFETRRLHTKTCSPACRKKLSRMNV